jgi:hypothetical protein
MMVLGFSFLGFAAYRGGPRQRVAASV